MAPAQSKLRVAWDPDGPEETWMWDLFLNGTFNDDTKVSQVKEHPTWKVINKGWLYDTVPPTN